MPVGGGGLIAGIAAYVKAVSPEMRVIGVEPDDAASMQASLAAVSASRWTVSLFADGVAVRQVGDEPFRLARTCVDEMVLVNTDEICAAIKDIFEDTRHRRAGGRARRRRVNRWVEREAARDRAGGDRERRQPQLRPPALHRGAHRDRRPREVLLAVRIPEETGSFRRFCGALGNRAITEFNYRYSDPARAASSSASGLRRRGNAAPLALEARATPSPT